MRGLWAFLVRYRDFRLLLSAGLVSMAGDWILRVGSGSQIRRKESGDVVVDVTVLTVNGERHGVRVEPDTPLLYVLRNHLGLMGTRFGCGLGLCGSCTVLLDGHPVHSCDTPLWSVQGKDVTTVEGLASVGSGRPSALSQAFVDEQAAQCGYCISGILVQAAALLAGNPDPSEQEVRVALDGNLCRCGAHNRIVRAVLRAANSKDGELS
jgi:nicotinate dehydrogenase subunit A